VAGRFRLEKAERKAADCRKKTRGRHKKGRCVQEDAQACGIVCRLCRVDSKHREKYPDEKNVKD